jgi:hypothetical protein
VRYPNRKNVLTNGASDNPVFAGKDQVSANLTKIPLAVFAKVHVVFVLFDLALNALS